MVLPHRPDGCTWTLDSFGTLKNVRMRCWDVQTDASLNSSNLVDTDGHPDAWLGRPDESLGSDFIWLGNCTETSLNPEKHISEINGIPEYVPTLYTSNFVKQNGTNHKLTTEITLYKSSIENIQIKPQCTIEPQMVSLQHHPKVLITISSLWNHVINPQA